MNALSRSLNIIVFDVPFPANYGGVIDVYYKLLWLKKQGIKIYLHCFTYGRGPAAELDNLCEQVFYYKRKTGLLANFSLLPYTVRSRQSKELVRNLLTNDHPVLFEVLHTCYLLKDKRLKDRKKIYRHSNIEHEYYSELSLTERRSLKKIYLKIEALKLKRFEKILKHADLILAVNEKDTKYFHEKYPDVRAVYLPSFHPAGEVSIKTGRGDYLLFHGNLSISENYEAAHWLIENVFSKTDIKVVIAGLNPPDFLAELIKTKSHMELYANPSGEQMDRLLQDAQAHVLYTAQPTGLKLKLLNVLFRGRFVVCNEHMVSGTGLTSNAGFYISDSPGGFIDAIQKVIDKNFTTDLISERKSTTGRFDNEKNIRNLIEEVF